MHIRSCTPSEPEEADGYCERADESGGKALFGFYGVGGGFGELGFYVAVQVEEERGDDDDGAEEDADEGETFFWEVEVVDAGEDEVEGFEPDVEEGID